MQSLGEPIPEQMKSPDEPSKSAGGGRLINLPHEIGRIPEDVVPSGFDIPSAGRGAAAADGNDDDGASIAMMSALTSPTFLSLNTNGLLSVDTLGLAYDDGPREGGADPDTASVAVSVITAVSSKSAAEAIIRARGGIPTRGEMPQDPLPPLPSLSSGGGFGNSGNGLAGSSSSGNGNAANCSSGEGAAASGGGGGRPPSDEAVLVNSGPTSSSGTAAPSTALRRAGQGTCEGDSPMDPETLDDHLFEVVNLMNSSITSVPGEERESMAKMNLRAGTKAAQNGSFDRAEVYFNAGRKLLGGSGWNDEPDLMLQLCSEWANACFVCGETEKMNALVDEVLSKDITIDRKFRVYEVKLLALAAAGDCAVGIDIAMNIRHQLGLRTMENKPVPLWKTMKEYIKTDRMLKKVTFDITMPLLEDKHLIVGQRVMELILIFAYRGQPTLLPWAVFEMVQTTIKHGINASSCVALSSMGMLYQCVFGNAEKASDLAVAVDQLLNNFPDVQDLSRVKAKSIWICNCFVNHWTSPIQQTIPPLIEAYQAALRSGDTESAAHALCTRSLHLFSTGLPLAGLQHELESLICACSQLNQTSIRDLIRADLIVVRKLRNIDVGEDPFESISTVDSHDMSHAKTAICRMELHVFFQDWSSATSLLGELDERTRQCAVGSWLYARYTFLESLASFKAAQAATAWAAKRRWKKRGVKSMKMLRKWVSKGRNPNIVHCLHILIAEHSALKGNRKLAKESFKKAALIARTNGFVQDKGLAHALASSYYESQGDQYWTGYHRDCAQSAYKEWGATALLKEDREEG